MISNPSQVIVLSEDYHRSSLHGLSAHHRYFPEVHGAGDSPKDAAERLAELLLLTLDNAGSDWRRQTHRAGDRRCAGFCRARLFLIERDLWHRLDFRQARSPDSRTTESRVKINLKFGKYSS